jgi:hypothetical protein
MSWAFSGPATISSATRPNTYGDSRGQCTRWLNTGRRLKSCNVAGRDGTLREPNPENQEGTIGNWCRRAGSNCGPTDYESVALPLSYVGVSARRRPYLSGRRSVNAGGCARGAETPPHPNLLSSCRRTPRGEGEKYRVARRGARRARAPAPGAAASGWRLRRAASARACACRRARARRGC